MNIGYVWLSFGFYLFCILGVLLGIISIVVFINFIIFLGLYRFIVWFFVEIFMFWIVIIVINLELLLIKIYYNFEFIFKYRLNIFLIFCE